MPLTEKQLLRNELGSAVHHYGKDSDQVKQILATLAEARLHKAINAELAKGHLTDDAKRKSADLLLGDLKGDN